MTERIMTRDAGAISIRAFEHAIRLGHPYLGGEHYLLAQPRDRLGHVALRHAGAGGDLADVIWIVSIC